MFALAIIEKLGEDDLTGGQVIAGTGTIDSNGEIGPIGGVRQKMIGAARARATAFLVPASNCPEVVGNVPANLQVVMVSRLPEAVSALKALASGQGQDLPTCLP
ncbi:MAG: hypothetical protein FWG16_08670 [Micrococcales bacterium]|nr:hypothetical protein [Micrococcales bacterium]